MIEMQLRQVVQTMPVQPAFKHVGHAHGVVHRTQRDATIGLPRQHQRIVFRVVQHLQDRRVFQQGLQ